MKVLFVIIRVRKVNSVSKCKSVPLWSFILMERIKRTCKYSMNRIRIYLIKSIDSLPV